MLKINISELFYHIFYFDKTIFVNESLGERAIDIFF